MKTKYNFLLFDLDNTLLDFTRSEDVALLHTFSTFGIEFNQTTLELYKTINERYWKEFEQGNLSISQVQEGRFSSFFDELDMNRSGRDGNAEYQRQLVDNVFTIDNAYCTLSCLSQRYDIYLVTNGVASTQRKRVVKAGFMRFFKHLFISEEIGVSKPSPSFFAAVMDYIHDYCPEKYLIIGDSLSSDISGGMNCGIDTCWFNPNNRPTSTDIRPSYVISDLLSLCVLL